MTIHTNRFDYIGRSTAGRIGHNVRDRRRKALDSVCDICVKVTGDGGTLHELIFDHPPTLNELLERAGQDVFLVSVQKRRREMREGTPRPMTLAAE